MSGTRDNVMLTATPAWWEGGESGRSEKKRHTGITTWGSVCFVFLTVYQHQVGFETSKSLNKGHTEDASVRQEKKP